PEPLAASQSARGCDDLAGPAGRGAVGPQVDVRRLDAERCQPRADLASMVGAVMDDLGDADAGVLRAGKKLAVALCMFLVRGPKVRDRERVLRGDHRTRAPVLDPEV